MAGLVGSLAMLLEPNRLGVAVDLDLLPVPAGVPLQDWLSLLPVPGVPADLPAADRVDDVRRRLRDRGLTAARIGALDDTGEVRTAPRVRERHGLRPGPRVGDATRTVSRPG